MGNNLAVFRYANFKKFIIRKTRRMNVENRTYDYLEAHKEKPLKAPTYEATMKEVEKLIKNNPESLQLVKEKNESLLKNLEKVYVRSEQDTSENIFPKVEQADASNQYGVKVVDNARPQIERADDGQIIAPEGKYTLSQIVQIISKYDSTPEGIKALAMKYNIDETALGNVVNSVKIYRVLPPMKKAPLPYGTRLKEEMLPKNFLDDDMRKLHDLAQNETKIEKPVRRSKKEIVKDLN